MKTFLKKYSYSQVKEAEKEAGYSWSTLVPLTRLVYFDYRQQTSSNLVKDSPLVMDLYMTSIRAGLFSLKIICSSPESLKVMEQEGIIDFVFCLPWFVTEELQNDARAIVSLMSQNAIQRPPRLLNIAKAGIAMWHGVSIIDMLSPAFIENVFTQLHK